MGIKNNQYNEKRISEYKPNGYSREHTSLNKLYYNQMKYSDNGNMFDYKFDIFLCNCENADIPADALEIAFPTMLKEEALEFYYSFYSGWQHQTIEELCKEIKDNFEGVEYRRTLLANWNKLTFESIVNDKENNGKTISECLKILTQNLRIMQHRLNKSLRNDAFIHNTIGTACESQPAFLNVCEQPANTINGLLSDLRSAAEYYD